MVNMPYRSSEELINVLVSARVSALRHAAAAIVLALIAAMILGAVLSGLPDGFGESAWPNLIPVDDPIALSTFTA